MRNVMILVVLIIVPGVQSEDTIQAILSNHTLDDTNGNGTCGGKWCPLDLNEICSGDQSNCVCPEGKDRSEQNKQCSDFKDFVFPLLLAKEQKNELLWYNSSYSENGNPVYADFVATFEREVSALFRRTKFAQDLIRVSVDNIFRPLNMNRSLSDGGLWVEFTTRFVAVSHLNDGEVYDEMIGVIYSTVEHSIGNGVLIVDPRQPPLRCFHNNCPKDGLCVPSGDSFQCQCPLGCKDLDPAKAGRVCSCPCTGEGSNVCDDFSDCIPSNNQDGYICECKVGFLDQARLNSTISDGSPKCVPDFCLHQKADCERRNSTCVVSGFGWECRCLDGYTDVRKSSRATAICLRPEDVDECALQLDNCVFPAACVKSGSPGYRCLCPDSSQVEHGSHCSEDSRSLCICSDHGTCVTSPDNSTICRCDEGYSGPDCSRKDEREKRWNVWKIGDTEIEWSWASFGIGAGIGVLACLLLFMIFKLTKRLCRKKPTVRPSIDDEVFNFHEVTRNVYGTGAIRESKFGANLHASEDASPPLHYACKPVEGPYAVSEVGVSTFKRNGQAS